jgi:hypothetical protein
MLYIIIASVVAVLLVVAGVVMWRRLHQENRKTKRDAVKIHTNPVFKTDAVVSYRDQHVTTARVHSAEQPTADSRDYDVYDASQSSRTGQAVYSSTAPGQPPGRSGAAPPATSIYEEPAPVYAEANSPPPGHQGRHGAAAVKLDRDLYVSNHVLTERDYADPYALPTLSTLSSTGSGGQQYRGNGVRSRHSSDA